MKSEESWFETAVVRLTDPQNQRVWSIIVSLLGDLAQGPEDRISGSALTQIIQPMGIKPEAIRVALHRLRKDGWIESTRSGRASIHFLTESGRSQSARVTPRIYDRDPVLPKHWHLIIAEDGGSQQALHDLLLTETYVPIGKNAALGAGTLPEDCEDLVGFKVDALSAPGWLQSRICPPDLVSACDSLRTDILTLLDTKPEDWKPSAMEIATLRTLVVHRWRRVALRSPDVPPLFFPDDWAGPACRKAVFQMLDALPRPKLTLLNGAE